MTAIYHNSQLPPEVVEIIADSKIDIAGVHASQEVVIAVIRNMVEAGSMAVFHSGALVVLLRAYTPYVGIVHLCISAGASPFALLRAGREFLAWAAAETHYHRIEGRTQNLRLALLAAHCGAEIEGVRRESWRNQDGSMADEYELGYILKNRQAISH